MADEKKMTMAEIKATAKAEVFAEIAPILEQLNVEMVGPVAYIPRTVGGQELWVEVKLTTKQYTDTSRSKAFDPFVAREAYEADQEAKRKEAEIKAKNKADKIKAKKAKTEQKTETEETTEN